MDPPFKPLILASTEPDAFLQNFDEEFLNEKIVDSGDRPSLLEKLGLDGPGKEFGNWEYSFFPSKKRGSI